MMTICYAKYSNYIIEIKTKNTNIKPVDAYINITNESTATYKLYGFSYTIISIQSIIGEYIDLSEIASLWTPYKNKDHNKVFMTFNRAFYHNFLSEKQWKFFPDGFNGYVRNYASNGQLILEYEIEIKYGNVNIIGTYNEWHPNGIQSKEIFDRKFDTENDSDEQTSGFISYIKKTMKNFSYIKLMKEWNSEGIKIKSTISYINIYGYKIWEGIENWFDNGTKKNEINVYFYEKGNPKSETTTKYWYSTGQLSEESYEVNHTKTVKKWYENGTQQSETNYINNFKKDGVQKKWNNYGELISKKYYKNGFRDSFLYKVYRKLF